MRYYRNCNEINIYSFDKLSRGGDFRYMVYGWDEYEELDIDQNKARGYWTEIYEEYCKLTNDNVSLMYYDLIGELNYLETRRTVATTLLNQIMTKEKSPKMFLAYIDELAEWGYPIDVTKDITSEYNKVIKAIKFSQNKINAKKASIKELKEGMTTESMSIIEQGVSLELALEKNDIDLKKTSVNKWLMLIKKAKERNERLKKRVA